MPKLVTDSTDPNASTPNISAIYLYIMNHVCEPRCCCLLMTSFVPDISISGNCISKIGLALVVNFTIVKTVLQFQILTI